MTEGKGLMCWQNQAIIQPASTPHEKSLRMEQSQRADVHGASARIQDLQILCFADW